MTSLSAKMARGAAWMVLLRIVDRSLGVVSMLVLARLLVPEDFGVVAMAMSIYAVVELLSEFSFDVALVQNRQADESHFNTAWTFNVIFATAAALVLAFLAVLASEFFKEPRLIEIIYCLAGAMFVRGFQNIGLVNFQKELRFDKEFLFFFIVRIVRFVTTLTFALVYRNYWALVIGTITGTVIRVILSYLLHPYRPKFALSAAGSLMSFSKWLLGNNLLLFIIMRLGDFIIGRIVGARALGLYKLSYELSNVPTTELIMPISRAVFPGYVAMSHNLKEMRQSYLDTVALIALLALPIGIGISVTAELFVPIVLGDNWLDSVPLIQILACAGAINILQANAGSALLALGQPKVITGIMFLRVAILIPLLLILTSMYGVVGGAFAILFGALVVMPASYWVLFRSLQLGPAIFIASIWRPMVSVTTMVIGVLWTKSYLEVLAADTRPGFVDLIIVIALGGVIYIGVDILLWVFQGKPEGPESLMRNRLQSLLGKSTSSYRDSGD